MSSPRNVQFTRGLAAGKILVPLFIVAGVIGYVAVAGSTGFCPTCEAIVRTITGGEETVQATAGPGAGRDVAARSIHQLVMTDLDGRDVPLAQFAGKPMLIDVWATWCGPCRKARTVLHDIAEEVGQYGTLVSLSVDKEGPSVVREYIDRNEGGVSPFLELMSSDPRLNAVLRPHDRKPTIPKLVFVDARGKVIDIEYGIPRPNWVLKRLRVLAEAGSRG